MKIAKDGKSDDLGQYSLEELEIELLRRTNPTEALFREVALNANWVKGGGKIITKKLSRPVMFGTGRAWRQALQPPLTPEQYYEHAQAKEKLGVASMTEEMEEELAARGEASTVVAEGVGGRVEGRSRDRAVDTLGQGDPGVALWGSVWLEGASLGKAEGDAGEGRGCWDGTSAMGAAGRVVGMGMGVTMGMPRYGFKDAPEGYVLHQGNAARNGHFEVVEMMQQVVDDTFAEFGLIGPSLESKDSERWKNVLPIYKQGALPDRLLSEAPSPFQSITGFPDDWYVVETCQYDSSEKCYAMELFNDLTEVLDRLDVPTRKGENLTAKIDCAQPVFKSDLFAIFVKNKNVKNGIGRAKLKKKPMLFFRVDKKQQWNVIIKSSLITKHAVIGHSTDISISVPAIVDIYSWLQWFRCDIRAKLLSLYPEALNGDWKPSVWKKPANRIWWTPGKEDVL